MRTFIISLSFAALVFSAAAQESADFSEPLRIIDAWLDAQKDYENIPGVSAGIVVDQELIWSEGYGYSDVDLEIAASDTTIYSICSISKLFTSIAILQLRDQGKLDLDDTIDEHLPWFSIKKTHPKSSPITIRSILTHSSGLPRESDYPYWSDPTFPFPNQEQLRDRLAEQATLYPASTVFQYSNLGISLLGEIVAEKTGMSYEDYVTKNILKQLGLNDTRPLLPESLRKGQLATGYSVESREGLRDELAMFQARGIAAAAGYSSTVKDLAEFASWQFKALEEVENPVLNGNTLREMQRVHWMDPDWQLTWGLGFVVGKIGDETYVGHSGGCPGYLTRLILIPKKKWAFIVMVNSLGISTSRYVESMYHIVNAYMKEEPEEISANVNLEDYSGRYYDFWSGESVIVPWKGKLAVFSLRSTSHKKPNMIMKHIEGDLFKRIRDDGELGEEIRFERDEKGRVIRMWDHSNYEEKL